MFKRIVILLETIYYAKAIIPRSLAFFRRSLHEGLPQTIKRLNHISNPQRHPTKKAYNNWLVELHQPTKNELKKMTNWALGLKTPPKISIILPVYNSNPKWLLESVDSVINQIYPNWELCIADDASTDPRMNSLLKIIAAKDKRIKLKFCSTHGHISICSNSAISIATGEWFALLDHDDLLSIDALIWIVKSIVEHPEVKLIYSDEDQFRSNKSHCNPYFKANWDPLLAEGQNFFSHLGVYNANLVKSVGGFRVGLEGSQDYDLILRCSEQVKRCQIYHIPRVLYHMRLHQESSSMGAKPYTKFAAERALGDHLKRINIPARIVMMEKGFRVMHNLTSYPLVSIIIPTRDNYSYLVNCIDSILTTTNYKNFEIIIIDNDSKEHDCLAYLKKIKTFQNISIIEYPGIFNYSAIVNKGAENAQGDLILLLNNDVIVLHQDWLEEMIGQALRPGTGAVGAKLLYPNHKVQHAGIILGIGGVGGHAHLGLEEYQEGYFSKAVLTHEVSAVTAAALMVSKKLFFQVGGFNEQNLPVAFNDIDFCLKLINAGYHNAITPFSRLIHHESISRGLDDIPENAQRYANEKTWMQGQWGFLLNNDPTYNPNLSLESHNFELSRRPRLSPFQE